MNTELDQAAPIRPGEELDLARLEAYLRERLPQFAGELVVEQFPHGHSNLTYLVRVGATELVLRRPPFGNQVATAHDMGREYRVLSKLSAVFPAAPRPYLFCDDVGVLGSPFYVMERRRGLILRKTFYKNFPKTWELAMGLDCAFIDKLAQLHAVDFQAAGLADLGKPAGYVARQVSGWSDRYVKAQTDDLKGMEQVARWLADNMPPESGTAILHNDFKFDNVVLDPVNPERIVAVLDWEMATLGDPLMDLGTTLGYWVEANDPLPLRRIAFGPTMVAGSLTRRDLVDRYAEISGREIRNWRFYYCFGLFKVAVIVQQIYARFVRGTTHDPRFAQMNEVVAVLSRQAERAIEAGTI